MKKGKQKRGQNVTRGGGHHRTFFNPNLPGPHITIKWTMHTDKLSTKCHLCAYLQAGWLNMRVLGLVIHDSKGSQR